MPRGANVVVFIDFEHIVMTLNKHYVNVPDAETIARVLKERIEEEFGGILAMRAYRDWARDDLTREDQRKLDRQGITTVQVTPTRGGKDRSDPEIIVDAMDMLCMHRDINSYLFVTGDGDYKALIRKLRERGKETAICALSASLNSDLVTEVSKSVLIDQWLGVRRISETFQGLIRSLYIFEKWAKDKNIKEIGLKGYVKKARGEHLGCEDTEQAKAELIAEAHRAGIVEIYESVDPENEERIIRCIRLNKSNQIVQEIIKKYSKRSR